MAFVLQLPLNKKLITKNSRSTVATSTEIYDYLKLLFSRVGRTFSPLSGDEVKCHSTNDVINFCIEQKDETDIYLLAPLKEDHGMEDLQILMQKGFTRLWSKKGLTKIEEIKKSKLPLKSTYLLVDRIIREEEDSDQMNRFAESADLAFWEGNGECAVLSNDKLKDFNNRFELDGISFEQPSKDFLSLIILTEPVKHVMVLVLCLD